MSAIPSTGQEPGFDVAIRFAVRELRSGLKGFYVFLACIAIGVATIAGVGSLARAMSDGIANEGEVILGGDLSFVTLQRPPTDEERTYANTLGRVSEVLTLRAMARVDAENQALVEIKAVDNLYPLAGTLRLQSEGTLADALVPQNQASGGDVFGAVVEEVLLARLDLEVGDTVTVGEAGFVITDVIASEPDRLSGGAELGPRFMMSAEALVATDLNQPGALIRWHQRVLLPDGSDGEGQLNTVISAAVSEFSDTGVEIRSRTNASPGLTRSVDRFAQFLTLVGLTALIVGGVGVANAVRAYLDTKREVIATFKALGATGRFVSQVYLLQIMLLAFLGTMIGVVVGALVPPIAGAFLANILPVSAVNGLFPAQLLLAIAYGLLTALAFALWPIGFARDVPVAALFRDRLARTRALPRAIYIIGVIVVLAALAGLAISLAAEPWIAIIYLGASAAAFIILRVVASGMMFGAKRAPRAKSTEVRLALSNIHRPGALTPSVVLSLGLGLALLVTLGQIDGNLSRQLTSALPERAPSFFFLDVRRADEQRFVETLVEAAPQAEVETVPMLRGRVVSLKGVPAAEYPTPNGGGWVLRGDRGLTHANTLPENSALVEGEWWAEDYDGPPLVSFVDEEAIELDLNIGDKIVVNVLGRNIEAEIANLRAVEWESMGINFLMVFSSNTFRGAPYTVLATLTPPDGVDPERDKRVLQSVTSDYPAVTSVRVKDALETINGIVERLALAIRSASGITLVSSILVLAGALAAGHRHRIYDAVILKTLGATRGRLLAAYAIEYLILGLATAIFGVFAGVLAAYAVVQHVMQFDFVVLPGVAAVGALAALFLTVLLGIGGTWQVLSRKPARVLRAL
ncbi:MAG: FtsX-like permease family protein [Pseudomonadota bacterium]